MTTTRLLTALIGIFLVGEFWSCADHRLTVITPGANRLRVKTITQLVTSNASVSTVSAFSYDGQGRISSILAYQIPDSTVAPVENTVYQYDAQNRLTQVRHSAIRRGSNAETYTFGYNGAGQLTQLGNSPSTFTLFFQYNSANQLTNYSKSIGVSGLNSSGGGGFTFTGNNLTAASESFSVFRSGGSPIAPPVYSRSISATFTFDNKLNPFYGTFIVPAPGVFLPFASSPSAFGPFYTLYGGIDNPNNLSQNNILTTTANGVTTVYNYTYNASNLPTSRTTVTTSGVTEILEYDYESY